MTAALPSRGLLTRFTVRHPHHLLLVGTPRSRTQPTSRQPLQLRGSGILLGEQSVVPTRQAREAINLVEPRAAPRAQASGRAERTGDSGPPREPQKKPLPPSLDTVTVSRAKEGAGEAHPGGCRCRRDVVGQRACRPLRGRLGHVPARRLRNRRCGYGGRWPSRAMPLPGAFSA
jgi:hypothetical protein